MKKFLVVAAMMVTSAALVLNGYADEGLKSGPQKGENARPKPFLPLNINGPTPNQKVCLVCRNNDNPVAMVFAREPNENLVKLMKALDAETIKHADKKMGSFAVFCNDSEGLQAKLTDLVKSAKLEKFTLAIDTPTGPAPYHIAKDADITVVLYTKSIVVANYAFKKGEFKAADVEKIVSDVSKIVK